VVVSGWRGGMLATGDMFLRGFGRDLGRVGVVEEEEEEEEEEQEEVEEEEEEEEVLRESDLK